MTPSYDRARNAASRGWGGTKQAFTPMYEQMRDGASNARGMSMMSMEKGKKSRWVAYDEGTKILLQEFLRKFPPKRGAPLFVNIRDHRPSAGALRRYIEQTLKSYAARAALPSPVLTAR